jgi:hypothetical protein
VLDENIDSHLMSPHRVDLLNIYLDKF